MPDRLRRRRDPTAARPPAAQVLVGGRRRPSWARSPWTSSWSTAATTVAVGDEVVLIGRQGDEAIAAQEWADRLDTIAYEVVCGIGPRVPRHYHRSAAEAPSRDHRRRRRAGRALDGPRAPAPVAPWCASRPARWRRPRCAAGPRPPASSTCSPRTRTVDPPRRGRAVGRIGLRPGRGRRRDARARSRGRRLRHARRGWCRSSSACRCSTWARATRRSARAPMRARPRARPPPAVPFELGRVGRRRRARPSAGGADPSRAPSRRGSARPPWSTASLVVAALVAVNAVGDIDDGTATAGAGRPLAAAPPATAPSTEPASRGDATRPSGSSSPTPDSTRWAACWWPRAATTAWPGPCSRPTPRPTATPWWPRPPVEVEAPIDLVRRP